MTNNKNTCSRMREWVCFSLCTCQKLKGNGLVYTDKLYRCNYRGILKVVHPSPVWMQLYRYKGNYVSIACSWMEREKNYTSIGQLYRRIPACTLGLQLYNCPNNKNLIPNLLLYWFKICVQTMPQIPDPFSLWHCITPSLCCTQIPPNLQHTTSVYTQQVRTPCM